MPHFNFSICPSIIVRRLKKKRIIDDFQIEFYQYLLHQNISILRGQQLKERISIMWKNVEELENKKYKIINKKLKPWNKIIRRKIKSPE